MNMLIWNDIISERRNNTLVLYINMATVQQIHGLENSSFIFNLSEEEYFFLVYIVQQYLMDVKGHAENVNKLKLMFSDDVLQECKEIEKLYKDINLFELPGGNIENE